MLLHHVQIAQRAFNTPLLIDPAKAAAFLAGLGPRITGRDIMVGEPGEHADGGLASGAHRPARSVLVGAEPGDHDPAPGIDSNRHPFPVIGSVAVIGITGTLVHRGAWIGESSGLTSYEGIGAQLQAARDDPTIRGIALDIDSFGGEVAGAFDLADRIRAAREAKPVQAFVADHALSAGYALAAQAERIVLSRTGAVGSIGVLAIHTDMSGALEKGGLRVTLIHAGAHKVDANPYGALPDTVQERIAGELEELRELFARTVADGRGNRLDGLQALQTEAAVFRGEAAVFAGLADEVADPARALRAFVASLGNNQFPSRKDLLMSGLANDSDQQHMDSTPGANASLQNAADPAHSNGTSASADPATHASQASAAVSQEAEALEQGTSSSGNAQNPALTPEAIRAEAAEVAQVCAQAARLGIRIDAADAVMRGLKPDALRATVLADLAARGDAAGIMASTPLATPSRESPLVTAARKSAAAGTN